MAISDYMPFLFRPPAPRFVTESGAPVHGVLAQFDDLAKVYHAAEKMRDEGFTNWDVHSPFPIHGIEEAMGQRRTILPFIVGGAAFTGVAGAMLMQWYMNGFDFRFVVQGKPDFAWEPFLMVTFELGVLFSAFAALFGMLALNGLPRWNHPLLASERFLSSSDDTFFIVVEATDPKFDPLATRRLLESLGASAIELVEEA